jgi:MMPL family
MSGRPSADSDESVAQGLARTGRVVTAAALVMPISFAALIAAQVALMRMFGVGLTLAVLVDATLVRILLVPAFMRVLGSANWWAPKPMARLHAWFGISEASTPEPTKAAMKKSGQCVDTRSQPVGGAVRESHFRGQSNYLVAAGETRHHHHRDKTTTIPIGTDDHPTRNPIRSNRSRATTQSPCSRSGDTMTPSESTRTRVNG